MDYAVLLSNFGIIFLAELGDKTQLTAMALATRYPWKKIFIGIAAAFALLNVAAVLVGKVLFEVVPIFWIKILSGALFFYFGMATLLAKPDGESEDEAKGGKSQARGPVLTAFFMILLAELGDKTQIVTASLAAQYDSPLSVFLGSTAALWSVSLIGIFLGRQLTRFIPLSYIQKAAGCLFLVFGVIIVFPLFYGWISGSR